MPQYKVIPFEQLTEPPLPVRFTMDDEKMRELVDSIRVHGILQNLVVVPVTVAQSGAGQAMETAKPGKPVPPSPMYEVVAGHRRYKAAQIIGLKEVPALIFEDKDIAKEAAMLDENLCREDITPAEEGVLYSELIAKFDLTEQQLLDKVKRPPAYVYARLDLLRGNQSVFDAVKDRQIVLSVAQQLNRVKDAQHCRYLLALAVEGGATARTVMQWVQEYVKHGPSPVVDVAPLVEQGARSHAESGPPRCFLCGSNSYQANIVWVPVHDFERDQLVANVQAAARAPVDGTDGSSPE